MQLDGPPFRVRKDGVVVDCRGEAVELFKDTHDILNELAHSVGWEDTHVAFVSRTSYPEYAFECLRLIKIGEQQTPMHDVSKQRERERGREREREEGKGREKEGEGETFTHTQTQTHTHTPPQANACCPALVWQVAKHHEVYPGTKTTHFERIHRRTGIAYEDMVFFDNEYRNVRDVQRLGVTCVYTPEGFRRKYFKEAMHRLNGGGK